MLHPFALPHPVPCASPFLIASSPHVPSPLCPMRSLLPHTLSLYSCTRLLVAYHSIPYIPPFSNVYPLCPSPMYTPPRSCPLSFSSLSPHPLSLLLPPSLMPSPLVPLPFTPPLSPHSSPTRYHLPFFPTFYPTPLALPSFMTSPFLLPLPLSHKPSPLSPFILPLSLFPLFHALSPFPLLPSCPCFLPPRD